MCPGSIETILRTGARFRESARARIANDRSIISTASSAKHPPFPEEVFGFRVRTPSGA